MPLSEKQEQMCSESKWDFSDLKAVFLNCTLKKSPELSHTQGLIDISIAIMEKNGITTECLRPIDYDIATGVWPDMTEHGWDKDDWPQISQEVMAADILDRGRPSGPRKNIIRGTHASSEWGALCRFDFDYRDYR